uniref:EF-hand domain-containing protein n=1 Tax=Alexandrium monilatum TaxID=311494 RepID=A0A7S4UUP5_9DINO
MANSSPDPRLTKLTLLNGKTTMRRLRSSQVWQRCGKRLVVVASACAALAMLVGSACLWHRIHHRHHHHHRHARHRPHLPGWMHFPGSVKLQKARIPPGHGYQQQKHPFHIHFPGIGAGKDRAKQPHPAPAGGGHDHGHGHGHGHHDHSIMEELVAYPRVFVAEVVAVVALSTLFETWEHWIRHRLAHQGRTSELKILDGLFKEVTCLGFIGLVLYLVHRFTIIDSLASHIFSPAELTDENPLFETFELVHMMIFLLLIVLLFQAAALLPLSHRIVERWRRYERTRAWGGRAGSLESQFVEAGFLRREAKASSPRGCELQFAKPFTYGDTFRERLKLRTDDLVLIVKWRALRQEFMFPSTGSDDGKTPRTIPRGPRINPALFSFEGYLRGLLSNTVVALVEVDMTTWLLTLAVLIPLMYSCILFSCSIEFLQCVIAWCLLAGAMALVVCLEEDMHALTPEVPRDARMILRLLCGTSIQDFQRHVTPSEDAESHHVFGAPGLGGVEKTEKGTISRKSSEESPKGIFSCETYRRLIRLVSFWQAICVTSLVVSFLSHPFIRRSSIFLHCLAWAEWPIMLFLVWPVLVRKLTLRYSVDEHKDVGLIRAVALHSKENLLRHHLRLVQAMGFFRRASQSCEPWAQLPVPAAGGKSTHKKRSWTKAAYTKAEADRNFNHGVSLFQGMGDDDQEEVWELFELLDRGNDEAISTAELIVKFRSLGFGENADTAVRSLLRLVEHSTANHAARYMNDHGGAQCFTWEKFRAMIALTTTHRPSVELEEDLERLFRLIDKASPETVTVFEITEWMRGIKRSLSEADVATVLHKHFGEAKPLLTRTEFVEFFQAIASGNDDQDAKH